MTASSFVVLGNAHLRGGDICEGLRIEVDDPLPLGASEQPIVLHRWCPLAGIVHDAALEGLVSLLPGLDDEKLLASSRRQEQPYAPGPLAPGCLIRLKRIYNFLCSMLVL
jgi:hypothetical protein